MNKYHKITVASAAALTLACAYVKPWEGLWLTARVDTIGTGRPVTACYGETEGGLRVGDRFTKKECDDLLTIKLARYDAEIGHCIHVDLPDATRAALVSFSYNVGSSAACRSGAFRLINQGKIALGCNALMQWTRAQGRVVRGLVNRRAKERKLCLAGLDQLKPHLEPAPSKLYREASPGSGAKGEWIETEVSCPWWRKCK